VKNDLTHLDLFSGIGGFAIAARSAGFRTVGFSEVEPYACRVLRSRFAGVPNLGDVRKPESFSGLGPVTILSAGYPCQGESLTGLRLGASDDRWLWPATRDIIPVARPTWFIGENVLGHVTMGLDTVLSDLDGLGYAAQPFVIPACAVGAWHIRERVWILAHDEEGSRGSRDSLVPGRVGGHAQQSGGRARRGVPETGGASHAGYEREPGLGRLVHGVPNRTHRLEGTGNAIVPQIAENFFRWIAQIERGEVT
jgi:DNA (cytosine-5)-methyltransferase 1